MTRPAPSVGRRNSSHARRRAQGQPHPRRAPSTGGGPLALARSTLADVRKQGAAGSEEEGRRLFAPRSNPRYFAWWEGALAAERADAEKDRMSVETGARRVLRDEVLVARVAHTAALALLREIEEIGLTATPRSGPGWSLTPSTTKHAEAQEAAVVRLDLAAQQANHKAREEPAAAGGRP